MRAAVATVLVLFVAACGGKSSGAATAGEGGAGIGSTSGGDALVQADGPADATAAAARLDAIVQGELAELDRLDSALASSPVGPPLVDQRRVRVGYSADGKPPTTAISLTYFYELPCPHCASARAPLAELVGRYRGRITLIPRVMLVHRVPAMTAHLVTCAAIRRGKDPTEAVWVRASEAHDFASATLLSIAADAGVSAEDILTELDTGACGVAIRADAFLARGLGVRGTPTFLVNGLPVEGFDAAGIAAIIDAELARADAFVAAGGTIAGFHQDWWQAASPTP